MTKTYEYVCTKKIKINWYVQEFPKFTYELDLEDKLGVRVIIDKNIFTNYEINGNFITFKVTKELKDRCLVEVLVEVMKGIENVPESERGEVEIVEV